MGEDRVGKKGWAELGDGFAASVVAGEGANNPYERSCGRVWGLPPSMLAEDTRWREGDAAGVADGIVLPCWWWGRLFPATLESESTGEMVEVPARMPAHGRVSTPSRDGREGIGTGVSCRPEAN